MPFVLSLSKNLFSSGAAPKGRRPFDKLRTNGNGFTSKYFWIRHALVNLTTAAGLALEIRVAAA